MNSFLILSFFSSQILISKILQYILRYLDTAWKYYKHNINYTCEYSLM